MKAIKCGKIHTMTKDVIKDGVILVEKNKIREVGAKVSIPDDAEVIDASKYTVMPGMIDAHTHIGIYADGTGPEGKDHNEISEPITPHLRALDAIDPFDDCFREVMEAGITTLMIAPGSANPIGGSCSVLKSFGKTVEEMVIVENAGIKFALGENPKRVYGATLKKFPSSRMGIAGIIREKLYEAYNYALSKAENMRSENGDFKKDIRMEALEDVVKGNVPARFHAHKAYDILTAIRIAEEFDLDITIEHCTEGERVMEEIAKRHIPVILSPVIMPRTKLETKMRSMETAGILAKNGINVIIATDGISQTGRWLPINAGLCVRYGMKEEDALKAVTINAAKVLGISARTGSIEKGKDADLIITDGHPFETMSRMKMVLIDGQTRYSDGEL